MHINKKVNVSPSLNFKFDWKATIPVIGFLPRMPFRIEKILFVILQHCCYFTFFKINWLRFCILWKQKVKRKISC